MDMFLYMCHANLHTHTIYPTSSMYTCLQSVNTCKHVDMYMLLADTITHPIYTGVESLHIVVYIIYSSQYVNTHPIVYLYCVLCLDRSNEVIIVH